LGGASLSPRVARKILDSTEDNEKLQDCPLSARELEILHLLALGLNYRSIAEDLGVSPIPYACILRASMRSWNRATRPSAQSGTPTAAA
jgi:FixJ family two-component response regulator